MSVRLPKAYPPSFVLAAIIAYLVYFCLPSVSESLAQAIMRKWDLSEQEFDTLAIRAYPSLSTNLIAAHACFERFGDLSSIPGFYFCNVWRLDLDEKFSRTGYLMPVRNARGWFESLRAFRNPQDERGFLVKVRKVAA